MYLATNVKIVFPESRGRGALMFNTCSRFKIQSSWKSLTDTAEIEIAKALYFEDKGRVFELIKAGDPVYIEAGYNMTYNREFTGFISEILDDLPVMFKCEDNMYKLKRISVNKSYGSVTLATFLRAIVPAEFSIDAMDVNLGSIFYKQHTVATVLQDLKDHFGIYSYFVGNTLVSGKIYSDNPSKDVVKYFFDGLNQNIKTNNLKYRKQDDIRLKVTMTSHLSTGKKIKVTVGDEDGQEQKLVCSNVTSETEIKKLAEKELARLKIDGYQGDLVSFGIPFVRHGFTATLKSIINPDRDGNYYVDGVTTEFYDDGGIERKVKIGPRAA